MREREERVRGGGRGGPVFYNNASGGGGVPRRRRGRAKGAECLCGGGGTKYFCLPRHEMPTKLQAEVNDLARADDFSPVSSQIL